MAQFSTNEAVSLEKRIDLPVKPVESDLEKIDEIYEIQTCVSWIRCNNFKRVCLQFPDYLLPDSSKIALKLQAGTGRPVYILGDTAYESCCIDYIAASHIFADALIHFGPVCLSQNAGSLPVLYIYEKNEFDIDHFQSCLGELEQEGILLILDHAYFPYISELERRFKKFSVSKFADCLISTFETAIYLGGNDMRLLNLHFGRAANKVYFYDPKQTLPKLQLFELDKNFVKRRNFLIETIKDSNTIGIVVGTLCVKNYLRIIHRLKKLIKLNKKKYYLISVGKPTITKLANFPEIDCFCIITCCLNEIYKNREFYKPIVTPHDVECALNKNAEAPFCLDFNTLLEYPINAPANTENDVSLITGKLRQINFNTDNTLELNVNNKNSILVDMCGSGFLARRRYKGLLQNLGKTKVQLAEEGRSGLAQFYENEGDSSDEFFQ